MVKRGNPGKSSSEKSDSLKNSKISDYKKQKETFFRFPKRLRFPLAWTGISVVIGIIVQSFLSGGFVFFGFFWKNFINFFKLIGEFASSSSPDVAKSLFMEIFLNNFYYFLYTGGLISIIWAFISIAVHGDLKKKKFSKKELEHLKKIWELVDEGKEKLDNEEFEEARKIYQKIKREYGPELDKSRKAQNVVVQFYNDIVERYEKKLEEKEEESGKETKDYKRTHVKQMLFKAEELMRRGNTVESAKLYNQIADNYETLDKHDENLYQRISRLRNIIISQGRGQ